jgi:eukaryotic-like serine/threonine-protein kinase
VTAAPSEEGPQPLLPGEYVAPGYRVVTHLARGRALDVYDVWSEERYALCVAKMLRPDLAAEARARRRLRREGRLLLELTHPHIVRAYELIDGRSPVLVLEALTGGTLDYVLAARARPLPARELVFLGLQVCSAIRYLHAHGILHLDLKPANVISEEGLVKLIDLSVARPAGRIRRGLGTRVYLSPEQARGGRVDEAADVWGIGVVLYVAATATRPFEELEHTTLYPQLEARAEPVRARRRLPLALARLVDGCLETTANDRPTTEELFDRLERLAD